MLQKVTRLDSVPTAEETVLTTEVPTKESRLYTLLEGTAGRTATDSGEGSTYYLTIGSIFQNWRFFEYRACADSGTAMSYSEKTSSPKIP